MFLLKFLFVIIPYHLAGFRCSISFGGISTLYKSNERSDPDYFQLSDRLYQGCKSHPFKYEFGDANENYIDDGEDPSGDVIKDGDCESAQYLKEVSKANVTLGKYVCSSSGILETNLREIIANNSLDTKEILYSNIISDDKLKEIDKFPMKTDTELKKYLSGRCRKDKQKDSMEIINSIVENIFSYLSKTEKKLDSSNRKIRKATNALHTYQVANPQCSNGNNHVGHIKFSIRVPIDTESERVSILNMPHHDSNSVAFPLDLSNNPSRLKKNISSKTNVDPYHSKLIIVLPNSVGHIAKVEVNQEFGANPNVKGRGIATEENIENLINGLHNAKEQELKQIPSVLSRKHSPLSTLGGNRIFQKGYEKITPNEVYEFKIVPLFKPPSPVTSRIQYNQPIETILNRKAGNSRFQEKLQGQIQNPGVPSESSIPRLMFGNSNKENNLYSEPVTCEIMNFSTFKEKSSKDSSLINDLVKDLIEIGKSKDFPVYLEEVAGNSRMNLQSSAIVGDNIHKLHNLGQTHRRVTKRKQKRRLGRKKKTPKKF